MDFRNQDVVMLASAVQLIVIFLLGFNLLVLSNTHRLLCAAVETGLLFLPKWL